MLKKISTRLEDIMPLIREELDRGGSVRIHPRGVSMLPMIREGRDSVVLSRLPEKLRKYDVILYQRDDGQFVLHRLVKTKNGYVFWGDNHFEMEYGIEYRNMIARVTSFYRDDKQITVDKNSYRLYCRLWYWTRGLRRLIRCGKGLIYRALKKNRKIKQSPGNKNKPKRIAMKYNKLINALLNTGGKRKAVLLIIDTLCFAFVNTMYLLFASIGTDVPEAFWANSAIHIALLFILRMSLRVYNNVWRYTNTAAYIKLLAADMAASVLTILATFALDLAYEGLYIGVWRSMSVGAITTMLTLMSRFCYSAIYKYQKRERNNTDREPVVIIGAGRLGTYLAGDLKNNPNSRYSPVFFVDTDSTKVNHRVAGIDVYGHEKAERLIIKLGIRTVIITITHQDNEEMKSLYSRYSALGCKVQVCESLTVSDGIEKHKIREFQIEDLLFRKSIDINSEKTFDFYKDKVVLVTGGGGSIGSEICRQIALCKPRKLIIFDIYENNAYDIQQELVRKHGRALDLEVEIGSVRDAKRLDGVFERYKPQIVFHAAAHKHVPLMENSAAEAIKNNCLGTYNTANAAEKYGTEKFILISTDKAVNPTNVMGASKRMCEMIVQSRKDSRTSFAAVRFGNVLGSNGSVIPLFRRQIAEGGPITVTDKRIIRYFMTISEATGLVLESGAMARSGELFVLDMGKPVKIYDLAEQMIRMSGFEPGKDIEIKEIGLRPGEKLYEELLIKSEDLDKTENNLIFIEKDAPLTREDVEEKLALLVEAASSGIGGDESNLAVRMAMARAVPSYRSSEEVNKAAAESEEMKLASMTTV